MSVLSLMLASCAGHRVPQAMVVTEDTAAGDTTAATDLVFLPSSEAMLILEGGSTTFVDLSLSFPDSDAPVPPLSSANIARGDLDGSGLVGLVALWSDGSLQALTVSDDGLSMLELISAAELLGLTGPRAGDFDGDGLDDVLMTQPAVGLLLSDGSSLTPTFSSAEDFLQVSIDDTPIADFDGDGSMEAIILSTGEGDLQVLDWDGSSLSASSWSDPVTDLDTTFLSSGDFNGDGLADLAWYATGSGWVAALSDGSSFSIDEALHLEAGATTPGSAAVSWMEVNDSGLVAYQGAADFNGDGRTDIAAYQVGYGWSLFVSMLTDDGNLYFDEQPWSEQISELEASTGYPSVGDFNGDGLPDVAVLQEGATQWWLFSSTGSGFRTLPAFWTPSDAQSGDTLSPLIGVNPDYTVLAGNFAGAAGAQATAEAGSATSLSVISTAPTCSTASGASAAYTPNWSAGGKKLTEGLIGAAGTVSAADTGGASVLAAAVGVAAVETFWPSDSNTQASWDAAYEALGTIVDEALDAQAEEEVEAFLDGYHSYLMTSYWTEKTGESSTAADLYSALGTGENGNTDEQLFDLIAYLTQDTDSDDGSTSAPQSALSLYIRTVSYYVALYQELAILDAQSTGCSLDPGEDTWVDACNASPRTVCDDACTLLSGLLDGDVGSLVSLESTEDIDCDATHDGFIAYAWCAAQPLVDERVDQIGDVEGTETGNCKTYASYDGNSTCIEYHKKYSFSDDYDDGCRSDWYKRKDHDNSEDKAKDAAQDDLDTYIEVVTEETSASMQTQIFDVLDRWVDLTAEPITAARIGQPEAAPWYDPTAWTGEVSDSGAWVDGNRVRYAVSFTTTAPDDGQDDATYPIDGGTSTFCTDGDEAETAAGPWSAWIPVTGAGNPTLIAMPNDNDYLARGRYIYRQVSTPDGGGGWTDGDAVKLACIPSNTRYNTENDALYGAVSGQNNDYTWIDSSP